MHWRLILNAWDHRHVFVPSLRYPGTWLDGIPDPEKHDVESLLSLVEGRLADAAIALELYKTAPAGRRRQTREEYLSDQAELRAAVESEATSITELTELYPQVEHRVRSKRWANGEWPDDYLFKAQFVHARTFVSCLDMVGKAMGALEKQPTSGHLFTSLVAQWINDIPGLKDVRDSDQHADERVRGLEYNRQIALSSNIFQHGNLWGNVYTSTARDGSEASVEVSDDTLERAQKIVQGVLDALQWQGHASWKPHK